VKTLKTFGCLTLTVFAVMATGGTAAASEFTSPAGSAYTRWISGTQIGGHFVFHFEGALEKSTIECSSHLLFETWAQGPAVTATGTIAEMQFEKCTGSKVLIEQALGFMEFHALGNGNATVTSTGLEITTGLIGNHCKYRTSGTHFGTFTGSKSTGGKAILHLASASIPRTANSSPFCGSARLTSGGAYQIDSPSYLDIS
jgi:hypothetical protein